MGLPRLQLVELEDLGWWPALARDYSTDYLCFMSDKVKAHRPMAPLVALALRESRAERIVDLCSGGGGPVRALLSELAGQGMNATAVLTDRYPNLLAFRAAHADSDGSITFEENAVDARNVPVELTGLRTLFNAFHHFQPGDAQAILRDAVNAGQPIAIFEASERRIFTLVSLALLTPLIIWLTTPQLRPFRWSRLALTYLLPLVPLTCWWDGMVSQLRVYTPDELMRMATAAGPAYQWRAGKAPLEGTPANITYLVGWPERTE